MVTEQKVSSAPSLPQSTMSSHQQPAAAPSRFKHPLVPPGSSVRQLLTNNGKGCSPWLKQPKSLTNQDAACPHMQAVPAAAQQTSSDSAAGTSSHAPAAVQQMPSHLQPASADPHQSMPTSHGGASSTGNRAAIPTGDKPSAILGPVRAAANLLLGASAAQPEPHLGPTVPPKPQAMPPVPPPSSAQRPLQIGPGGLINWQSAAPVGPPIHQPTHMSSRHAAPPIGQVPLRVHQAGLGQARPSAQQQSHSQNPPRSSAAHMDLHHPSGRRGPEDTSMLGVEDCPAPVKPAESQWISSQPSTRYTLSISQCQITDKSCPQNSRHSGGLHDTACAGASSALLAGHRSARDMMPCQASHAEQPPGWTQPASGTAALQPRVQPASGLTAPQAGLQPSGGRPSCTTAPGPAASSRPADGVFQQAGCRPSAPVGVSSGAGAPAFLLGSRSASASTRPSSVAAAPAGITAPLSGSCPPTTSSSSGPVSRISSSSRGAPCRPAEIEHPISCTANTGGHGGTGVFADDDMGMLAVFEGPALPPAAAPSRHYPHSQAADAQAACHRPWQQQQQPPPWQLPSGAGLQAPGGEVPAGHHHGPQPAAASKLQSHPGHSNRPSPGPPMQDQQQPTHPQRSHHLQQLQQQTDPLHQLLQGGPVHTVQQLAWQQQQRPGPSECIQRGGTGHAAYDQPWQHHPQRPQLQQPSAASAGPQMRGAADPFNGQPWEQHRFQGRAAGQSETRAGPQGLPAGPHSAPQPASSSAHDAMGMGPPPAEGPASWPGANPRPGQPDQARAIIHFIMST